MASMYSHHCGPKVGIGILAEPCFYQRFFVRIQKRFLLAFDGFQCSLSCGCITSLLSLHVACSLLPGTLDIPLHFFYRTVSSGSRPWIIPGDLLSRFLTKLSVQGPFPKQHHIHILGTLDRYVSFVETQSTNALQSSQSKPSEVHN